MRKYMHTEMHGRPVRLTRVPDTDRHLNGPEAWDMLTARKGDGQWWSMGRSMDPMTLTRLQQNLRKRAYIQGYHGEILKLWATEREGICFRWTSEAYINNEDIRRLNETRHADRAKMVKKKRHETKNNVITSAPPDSRTAC